MTSKPTETELPERIRAVDYSVDEIEVIGDKELHLAFCSNSVLGQSFAKEIVRLWNTRTPSFSDAQARESLTIEQARKQAEAILFQVFPPVRNIHSDSALAELRQLIALALVSASGLSTAQPTLSDAVQAESDAYAQGYQDGSVSQPTLQQAIECVRRIHTPIGVMAGKGDPITDAKSKLCFEIITGLSSLASTKCDKEQQ